MSSYAVVLDACVLAPMPLADTLLRMAEQGFYRPYWSDEILNETEATIAKLLTGRYDQPETLARRRINFMRLQFPEALVRGTGTITFAAGLPDPDDEHVLEAAVLSNAQAIVTLNVRHFPVSACEPYAIEVLDPDTFLINQFDLNSRRVEAILRAQAAAMRSPAATIESLLKSLERSAPEFVSMVENERL